MKFIEPLASCSPGRRKKRYYQFTAIDHCTRVRVLRIYERNDQKSAIQFLGYVLAKVTLTGTVRSWAERIEAERVAASQPGVRTVRNRIQVRPPT